jgi:alkanesulfonate monooxygenase SsuD/methylene tetrahydromethanopterin reductase-like flavin-dependent oxidoreductase (luciferase family)
MSLSQFAKAGVVAGFGAGQYRHEFEAVGYPFEARGNMVDEFGEILRVAFGGDPFKFEGKVFKFNEVQLSPRPRLPIPLLAGGLAPVAIRRAARFDGWLPARVTYATFARRIKKLSALRAQIGKHQAIVGAMPLVSLGRTREDGLRRLDIPTLLAQMNRSPHMVRPKSGSFERLEDLEGVVLAGTADDIREGIERFRMLGASFLIFDLRLRFADMHDLVAQLGSEVLSRHGRSS